MLQFLPFYWRIYTFAFNVIWLDSILPSSYYLFVLLFFVYFILLPSFRLTIFQYSILSPLLILNYISWHFCSISRDMYLSLINLPQINIFPLYVEYLQQCTFTYFLLILIIVIHLLLYVINPTIHWHESCSQCCYLLKKLRNNFLCLPTYFPFFQASHSFTWSCISIFLKNSI